jgi:hypothetical protein
MSALQNNYFNTYGEDKEIKEIRENLIRKIQGLSDFFEENKERFREKGLEAKAQASLTEIVSAAKNLSDKFRS